MVFSDDDDLLTQWWEEEDEYESESAFDHDDNDGLLAILLLADMEHERCKKKRRGSIPGREVLCDPCPCTRNTWMLLSLSMYKLTRGLLFMFEHF
ncbi:unnamed protein product [Urochloa humidicola]